MSAAAQVLIQLRASDRSRFQPFVQASGFVSVFAQNEGAPRALWVVDPGELEGNATERLMAGAAAHPNTPILIVAGPQDRDALAAIIEVTTVAGIVARDAMPQTDGDREFSELIQTLKGPRFGIERFLGVDTQAIPRFTRTLAASLDRDQLVEELEQFLKEEGKIRSRMVRLACDAVEELVTNAIYDAPTDAEGRRLYADTDRRSAVFLTSDMRPRLDVAVRNTEVIATMSDPHGSLDVQTVRRFLAQGLRGDVSDKAGGAGLGFARIYGLVDRLLVQIAPRRHTEITFVLDASTVRRDPAARPTGLLCVTHRA